MKNQTVAIKSLLFYCCVSGGRRVTCVAKEKKGNMYIDALFDRVGGWMHLLTRIPTSQLCPIPHCLLVCSQSLNELQDPYVKQDYSGTRVQSSSYLASASL